MTIGEAREMVEAELAQARTRFPEMHSPHEGLAIVEEEFIELRRAVFWGKGDKVVEAKQLAAMAMRFLVDCC